MQPPILLDPFVEGEKVVEVNPSRVEGYSGFHLEKTSLSWGRGDRNVDVFAANV
ncbi:hypothetical protein [Nitrosococcus wardiae]|uniref:hypothetical protein n=1 Tax=Nitrosococcus wardiae TaxID=1814290 RepID=UPI00141B1013|nr:hypothetical protein [Nitrosococcus wardiae]